MAIHLDHMIVPVRDKHAAAKRLAALLDARKAVADQDRRKA